MKHTDERDLEVVHGPDTTRVRGIAGEIGVGLAPIALDLRGQELAMGARQPRLEAGSIAPLRHDVREGRQGGDQPHALRRHPCRQGRNPGFVQVLEVRIDELLGVRDQPLTTVERRLEWQVPRHVPRHGHFPTFSGRDQSSKRVLAQGAVNLHEVVARGPLTLGGGPGLVGCPDAGLVRVGPRRVDVGTVQGAGTNPVP